ncbi:hypothetical protein [Sphingomonas sp. MMS24-J13]|uniref:hypothetical protein n=1 Tax=Sphingomonas sp. MMS24-J13 TaxID=3238686 RepID=UPI0038500318
MKVLKPASVNDATLLGSSIAETDYPAWSAGTEYGGGALVILPTTHRIYESAHAANLGNDPNAGTHWIDIGPTNRWAMFDRAVGTASTAPDSLSVTLRLPSAVDAIALLDVQADTVRVQVDAAGYDRTLVPNAALLVLFDDVPAAAGADIIVTAYGAAVAVGTLLAGQMADLGCTEESPTAGIKDYSRRSTDDYGVTTVAEGDWSKQLSIKALFDTADVDAVRNSLVEIRGTPALWFGEAGFDVLTVYGFFKDFSLDLELPETSYCTVTIEGLPTSATAPSMPAGDDDALRVLKPVRLTTAMLVSSSVPESDYGEWEIDWSYLTGARVISKATHRIYESVTDSNIGNDPTTSDSSKWIDIGSTNRWAMFDQALGSATSADGTIDVTLAPGSPVGALAVLDSNAISTRVQVALGGATIYDATRSPDGTTALLFDDLPAVVGAQISLSFTGAQLAIGTVMIGAIGAIGMALAGPTAAITDYSRKDTDSFGVTTIVERPWAKTLAIKSLIDTSAANDVLAYVASLRATPALWIGGESYDTLTVYGFFKDFSIELTRNISVCMLSLEGLTAAEIDDTSVTGILNYVRPIYRNAATVPDTPANNSGPTPTGWSGAPQPLAAGEYRWWSQAEFRAEQQLTNWTAPVKVGGVAWSETIDSDPDHPKPADGATNSGDPLSAFGIDGTVKDALDRADALVRGALQAVLMSEAQAARTAALELIDGKKIKLVVRQEISDREDGDTRIYEVLNLIGLVNEDGSAFIIDLDRVKVSPTQTFAARLSELTAELQTEIDTKASTTQMTQAIADASGAQAEALGQVEAELQGQIDEKASVTQLSQAISDASGAQATALTDVQTELQGAIDTKASVTQLADAISTEHDATAHAIGVVQASVDDLSGSVTNLQEVVVDPQTGVTAKAVLAINADGKVVGIVATNNGSVGILDMLFDAFIFRRPNGTVLFTNDGDTVKLPDVEVDTLADNSAIKPIVSMSSTTLSGASSSTNGSPVAPTPYYTIFSRTLTMNRAGLVKISLNFAQAFTSGQTSRPWIAYVAVDGVQRPESLRFGTVPGDSVSTVGYFYAPGAGDFTITAHWGAHNTIQLGMRSFAIEAMPGAVPPTDEGDGGDYGAGGTGGGGAGGGGWSRGADLP